MCVSKVLSLIGMPQPSSYIKKFLLVAGQKSYELKIPFELNIKKENFTIEETFLLTSVGEAHSLRKVGKNDSFTYSHEMRYEINGEKIQKKR